MSSYIPQEFGEDAGRPAFQGDFRHRRSWAHCTAGIAVEKGGIAALEIDRSVAIASIHVHVVRGNTLPFHGFRQRPGRRKEKIGGPSQESAVLECLAPDAVRLVGKDQVGALPHQVLAGLIEHVGASWARRSNRRSTPTACCRSKRGPRGRCSSTPTSRSAGLARRFSAAGSWEAAGDTFFAAWRRRAGNKGRSATCPPPKRRLPRDQTHQRLPP